MSMLKFFRVPFALSGTRTPVPDAADPSGYVSYIEGYGADYQRAKADPLSKNIERDKMNQVFFDATTAIGELQAQGAPDFITSALNGGSPFSYAAKAMVRYAGLLYVSLVSANTAAPTDPTKWATLPAFVLYAQDFKQNIAGADYRSAANKFGEYVSVADFGVVPDNAVANQSAKMQIAINAAIAGKFRLHVPYGRYRFADALTVSMPSSGSELFWLSGDLNGSTLVYDGTGDFITIQGAIGYLDMGPRVRISGLGFETPGATPTCLIRNKLAINVELDHLHFNGTTVSDAHIINEKAYGLELSYSVFRAVAGRCVKLLAAPADAEYSYVVGLKKIDFSTVNGAAVYVEGSAGLLMQHCIMQQCLQGVVFDSAGTSSYTFNAVLDSCWFEQNVTSDIEAPSNGSYWAEFTLRNCHFGFRSATLGGPATLPALIALDSRSRVTILGGTVFGGVICNISGASGAAATLFDAVGFAQVGTFAWSSFGRAGARAPVFTSDNGVQAAVPNGVATTFKVMPTDPVSLSNQMHMVVATITSGGSATYQAVGLVVSSGAGWAYAPLKTATNLTLSMAAQNLQVTQTSGAAADVTWTMTRLS